MRRTLELTHSPNLGALYAKAALAMLPGASLLPGGGPDGDRLPDQELVLPDVAVRTEHLAAYNRVCGFRLRNELPPTYPHVLAFPLHMALMTGGDFPFPPAGLVHVENSLVQHRPILQTERLRFHVRAMALRPHPKGQAFSLVTSARVGDECVWEEESTMLRRGAPRDGDAAESEAGTADERPETAGGAAGISGRETDTSGGEAGTPGRVAGYAFDTAATEAVPRADESLRIGAEWTVPADAGRRYAAVSGDRNPIHLHGLTARLFGFSHPIAHGMWTKARCLAFLEGRLSGAFAVHVRFRAPVVLPSRVSVASDADDGTRRFAVRHTASAKPHLLGAASQLH